jgi:hypothetical protein
MDHIKTALKKNSKKSSQNIQKAPNITKKTPKNVSGEVLSSLGIFFCIFGNIFTREG